MERWTYDKYKSPRLHATVSMVPDTGAVTLSTPNEDFEIDGGHDGFDPARFCQDLELLRDAKSPLWSSLRSDQRDDLLTDLVLQLDQLGLIEETALPNIGGHTDLLDAALDSAVEFAISRRINESTADGIHYLRQMTEGLVIRYLLGKGEPVESRASLASLGTRDPINDQDNFYLLTIELQLRTFERNCPLALVAVLGMLERLDSHAAAQNAYPPLLSDYHSIVDSLCGAGFDVDRVRSYVYAITELLVSAGELGAKRSCRHKAPQVEASTTGLQFILRAESIAADLLVRLGPPKVLQAIREGHAPDRLIKGCYIQEFQITNRFVEIIAPLLSKRLRPQLRSRLFRYYGEEFGHEKFEMQTCAALGISSKDLLGSSGLPLHQAFVDVFTYLGTSEPLAFMTGVFLTEGMTRAQSPLAEVVQEAMSANQQFTKVCSVHENLNDELNHPSLSRLLLADVPWIDGKGQRRALEYLSYLVELNYRTWEGLYDYYGREELPMHYIGLSI